MDWIFVDTLKRHFGNNKERTGVLIRATTRGAQQKDLLKYLKKQSRFKTDKAILSIEENTTFTYEQTVSNISDDEILSTIKSDVLAGGYSLINYSNYHAYEVGDNVINLVSMGSPTTEAIEASDKLLKFGIYANLLVVTSPDLLLGNLAYKNECLHFKSLVAQNAPIITIHDGEPGLLDNAGSILGIKSETLATRAHSKCGKPSDVYTYHGLNSDNIVQTALKIL